MRAARVGLAVVLALVLQTTLAYALFGGRSPVDLVLIVVVYAGLTGGPVAGLVTGTLAGLAQDSVSGGVIGVGGLAKTVVGFVAGALGTQFIVTAAIPRLVVFFGASLLHSLMAWALYAMIDERAPAIALGALATRAGANAVIGVTAFEVIESAPGAWRRWQLRRAYGRRRR